MERVTDTYWIVDEHGSVICINHGDGQCKSMTVRKEEFPLPPWRVAFLINEAFKFDIKAKEQQIREELGL